MGSNAMVNSYRFSKFVRNRDKQMKKKDSFGLPTYFIVSCWEERVATSLDKTTEKNKREDKFIFYLSSSMEQKI